MFKIVVLLITIFSCQKVNEIQENKFSDKESAIEFSLSILKEMDKEKKYDLYYVIDTKDSLLYVINTNKENRMPFMYFFDTIECKSIGENELMIYLIRSSGNPQNDCVGANYHFSGIPIEEINGAIFHLTQNNKKAKYTLLKKGNILKEIREDSNLIIEVTIEDVPRNSDKFS